MKIKKSKSLEEKIAHKFMCMLYTNIVIKNTVE